MTNSKDIKHNFTLQGLSIGDTFLGCINCWFRHAPHTGSVSQCPKCGKLGMSLLTVTEKDKELL